MIFLSNERKEKNTSEGIKTLFLNSLDQEGSQKFFDRIQLTEVGKKVDV